MSNEAFSVSGQLGNANLPLGELQVLFRDFCNARGWNDHITGPELMMLLTEEVGEVSKEVRNLHFNRSADRNATVSDLGDELVDAFNYICRIASLYNIDLSEAYVRKCAKIAKKYPV